MASKMKREESWHSVWVILNDAEAISKRKQLSGKCNGKLGSSCEVWMSSDESFFSNDWIPRFYDFFLRMKNFIERERIIFSNFEIWIFFITYNIF